MSVTVKPATGSNPPKTLSLSKTATVGDLRKALGVDSAPRFVFMGKLLADARSCKLASPAASPYCKWRAAARRPRRPAAPRRLRRRRRYRASIARAEAAAASTRGRSTASSRTSSSTRPRPSTASSRRQRGVPAQVPRTAARAACSLRRASWKTRTSDDDAVGPAADLDGRGRLVGGLDAIEAAARGPRLLLVCRTFGAHGRRWYAGMMGGAGMGNVMQELKEPDPHAAGPRLMSDPARCRAAGHPAEPAAGADDDAHAGRRRHA